MAEIVAERRVLGVPLSSLRAYTMLAALVALWIIFYYQTEGTFLTARNLSNLMRQTAVTGILAVGMLMVIVAGQIDLSVGSIVGLTGGIAAMVQNAMGLGLAPSLLGGVGVGLAIGALQGGLVAYANIPAFIVTLGGLLAWRGAIKGLSAGKTIPIEIRAFKSLGQDYLAPMAGFVVAGVAIAATVWFVVRKASARTRLRLDPIKPVELVARMVVPAVVILAFVLTMNAYEGKGVPIPVLILAAIALAGAVLTRNTTFGRYLYAIGGNADAARLSGISLKRHVLAVFCVMGALAGAAGIVYTARVGSASPDAGVLLELDAIAACVIGGASLVGGRGTVLGACLGAVFMASLDNGMSLQNVEDYKMDIVKGAILVTAVGLDMLGRKR